MIKSTLSGNLTKKLITVGNKQYLIKTSSPYSHEAVYEVLVSNLLDILGIPHVCYILDYAEKYGLYSGDGYASICEWLSYSPYGVISFFDYLDLTLGDKLYTYSNKRLQPLYDKALLSLTAEAINYICLTLFIDALVSNSDRHFRNIDLINRNGVLYPFPMYDFGNSFASDNKWLKDRAMPFRSTHNKQLKFIHSLGFNYTIGNPMGVYSRWLSVSSDLLQLLPNKEVLMSLLKDRIFAISKLIFDI